MGAWGSGPFENDTALDWWDEFRPESVRETLEAALERGLQEGPLDAHTADEAVAALALVALACDSTLPEEWCPEMEGELPRFEGLRALAADCVPPIAGSESAELWAGDKPWWSKLASMAKAVDCPKEVLDSLGPVVPEARPPKDHSLPPAKVKELKEQGYAAINTMKESGRAKDRAAFDEAMGTFFYCAAQVNPNAVQKTKEMSLAEWVKNCTGSEAFDAAWELAESREFGMLATGFKKMLNRPGA